MTTTRKKVHPAFRKPRQPQALSRLAVAPGPVLDFSLGLRIGR